MTTSRRLSSVLIVIGSLTLFSLGTRLIYSELSNRNKIRLDLATPVPTHPLRLFDRESFIAGVARAGETPFNFTDAMVGGVVPHHTLAGYLIAGFFSELAKQEIDTIFILGPNHEEAGGAKVLSGFGDWETPFGRLETDQDIIGKLQQQGWVGIDEDVIGQEIAISTLVPYIKYYLPKAKIVPIIFKAGLSLKEVESFRQSLEPLIGTEKPAITSVDFSHYLSKEAAEINDAETIGAIRNFDLSKILAFNSDHLDSSPSLVLLMSLMREKKQDQVQVLYHTNSSEFTGKTLPPTTGYFILSFNSAAALRKEYVPNPPTRDIIFGENHDWVATLSADKIRVLAVTGDVIPARSVNYRAVTAGNFTKIFEPTAEILNRAALTFINLESPLIDKCPLTNIGMIFCGDPRHLLGLIKAGVDVVNLANNHTGNYGPSGIKQTKELLERAEISTVGLTNQITMKEVNHLRFAFLGYDDIERNILEIAHPDLEKIDREIEAAKKVADIVVVSFHWGTEYTGQPNRRQRELAHRAIDAGADLILGNHPHWIQPVEIYKGKVIMYAHGNFVFDQNWSEKTREGVIGRYTFYDRQLIDVEFLPVYLETDGQPKVLAGNRRKIILDNLENESTILARSYDKMN